MFFERTTLASYHHRKIAADEQNVGFDVRRPSRNVDFFWDKGQNITKFVVVVGKFGGRQIGRMNLKTDDGKRVQEAIRGKFPSEIFMRNKHGDDVD